MNTVCVIARRTLLEISRDRIVFSLLIAAGLAALFGQAVGWVAVEVEDKVSTDVSLSAVSILAAFLAIFLSTRVLHDEHDRGLGLLTLAGPIRRYQLLLGKLLGLILVNGVIIILMGVTVSLILGGRATLTDAAFPPYVRIWIALFHTFLELVLISSLGLAFSVVATPLEGALFTGCFYIAGHATQDLVSLAETISPAAEKLALFVFYLLPSLWRYGNDVRLKVAHPELGSLAFTWGDVGLNIVYALLYSAFLFGIAASVYRRRKI